jgi:hypothetical protein
MNGLPFLAPAGLIALVAAAIVIVIHMRRRTPPVRTLPSIRFWSAAPEDHAERSRLRRPPLTLPLILQVLAAMLIALALARPIVEGVDALANQRSVPEHAIVILDGSTSMGATDGPQGETSRWDLAIRDLDALLDDWQPGDVTTVIVTGGRLQSFSGSTTRQIDDIRAMFAKMASPGGRADVDSALTLAADLLLPDRANRLVVITDGSVRANPAVAALVRAPIELRTVGEAGVVPNLAVTSIGARELPGQSDQQRLAFTLASFGEEPVRAPYTVQADGVDVVTETIDLAPGASRSVEVNLPPEATNATVAIQTLDAQAADNRATVHLSSAGISALDILLLSDAPGSLERALSAIPDARVETFETTTPGIAALSVPYDLVVFEGFAPPADDLPTVPMLFLRPQQIGETFAIEGVMASPEIDQLQVGDPILEGVDLAGVTFGETPRYRVGPEEQVLVGGTSAEGSGPLIWRGVVADQPTVALAFDLASSNISQRVAFPVLVSRIVADLTVSGLPSTVVIGEPVVYAPSLDAAQVTFSDPLGEVATLAVSRDDGTTRNDVTFDDTGLAGVYTVREFGADGQVVGEGSFVVNAGHPEESNLRPIAELAASLVGGSELTSSPASRIGTSELWPLFAIAALLLIVAEWLVACGLRSWFAHRPPVIGGGRFKRWARP